MLFVGDIAVKSLRPGLHHAGECHRPV